MMGENLNRKDLEEYCEYYFINFGLGKQWEKKMTDEKRFTVDDYENIKYLIKLLNGYALEVPSTNPNKSYSYLAKAYRLSKILWKNVQIFEESLEILKTSATIQSTTLNNIGCYFKSKEKYEKALKYLQKAVKIEKIGGVDHSEIGTTLINVSAVLSKLQKHEEALNFAAQALETLEKISSEKEIPEVLATAYFNYAVELEYLKKYQEAKKNYEKAYSISKEKLGEDHSCTTNFLDKLVKFNFTYSTHTEPKKKEKKVKKNDLFDINIEEISEKPLYLLYQNYKFFKGIRFKIIIINKYQKDCVKILAFPEFKYPVYRMIVPYQRIFQIYKYPASTNFNHIENEELQQKMKNLVDLIVIEKGEIKLMLNQSQKRPISAFTKFLT